ncbi:MAG TPA: glutamate synthase-related protein, partial [Bacillota bacterium]
STVDAYQGAQIFEAIGLAQELIDRCFHGTPSRVGGASFAELAEDVLAWHRSAFGDALESLDSYGFYKFKKDGEYHEFNPAVIRAMQRITERSRGVFDAESLVDYETRFKPFVELVKKGPPSQLRDLMEIVSDREPIPIDEVEPLENITRRFSTAAISLGSISPEAHETIAIAMNRIGGRSNTGEGGEDPARYGTEKNSAVKQVASGRFGVTPAYLANGIELQIKIAQGSKPGEGGQIPGHKVSELIARLRHTVPGVELISPPPHHDIYSIEDLAQLIYDLKQANPNALVSVKLVSETGVGIIAAGVAKGFADAVHIAGHAGGTGSSPLTSIKNAGLPWELGLVETQHALVENGLRGRITVRVDGGLKTGRDVIIAALLGADEYSFGTAALVAEGCVMARACHTNNCPVGIATQKGILRERFSGTPEGVADYFLHLAYHVRELLAQMGYRSLDEIIGRADLLRQKKTGDPRADRLDLSALLVPAGDGSTPRRRLQERVELPDAQTAFGRRLAAELREAIETATPVERSYTITNADRTVGATIAYEIAKRYGDAGLPEGTLRLHFEGCAGQSFGAFCIRGLHLVLTGQANDYVGKGMGGGEIVVKPQPGAPTDPERHTIIGNTVLYGATGGHFFAAGAAGERFAVRNSGAIAVVEGVGDHACEYMTGGIVVILGRTGYNLGAGMTGGEAFVYDPEGALVHRHNAKFVKPMPVSAADAERLRLLIEAHYEATGSPRARDLLDRWDDVLADFRHVLPLDGKGGLRRPPHARPEPAPDAAIAYAGDD